MNPNKYQPLWAPDGPGGGASPPTTSAPPSSSNSSGSVSGPGTSSPAPSGSSTTSPEPAASPASAGEAFDFSSIFDGGDTESAGAGAPAEAPPAPPTGPEAGPPQEKSPVAAPTSVQPPATEPPAPVSPAAAPAAPAGSTPQTAPSAPSIDLYDPAALAQGLVQNEEQIRTYVADNLFKLTPQEIEALETNVVEAIPQLLSRVFVKSQQNVLSQLGRIVPVMIQRQAEMMKRNASNEDRFYARWPDIKQDLHGDLVRKYAAVYRQMHPDTKLDPMIEDLGPMIMMAAKIVPQAAPASPTGPTVKGPMAPANGRSPQPSPFAPAGAGPTTAPRAQDLEAWEAIFREPPT